MLRRQLGSTKKHGTMSIRRQIALKKTPKDVLPKRIKIGKLKRNLWVRTARRMSRMFVT